ncbi:hypothetical protein SteCoe_23577 [Stentor coeruleus]|uniref:RING-type domain-containing protein n=1 Tax=Stentor coeruleus TaxID=5963 RepID=A0A1R2BJK5_9CILI|nr:hypothetical protein SteCoe_23577 [Stentor coeruleus]
MEGCSSQHCKIGNIKLVHGNHRLCEECLGEYFEKYNTIECKECKNSAFSLMQNYYLCECEFSVEKYYLKTCRNHIYCNHCIQYSNFIDKCEFCEATFNKKKICMHHFDIIDNCLSIANPACSNYFSHTYCEKALIQINEEFDSLQSQCHWCKLLYTAVEIPFNICALCKINSIEDTQQTYCESHRHCNKCIASLALKYFQVFLDIQDCSSCKRHFKNSYNVGGSRKNIMSQEMTEKWCDECNQKSQNLILNPSCLKNHSYCDKCFKNYKNKIKIEGKKCEKCLIYYSAVKEHMCHLCKKAGFNLIAFSTCQKHLFCLKCFKILLSNFQKYDIQCSACSVYLKNESMTNKNINKCFGCNQVNQAYINPSCDIYHEYCEKCIKKYIHSCFECESCKTFNSERILQLCDLCKATDLSGSRVAGCQSHSYCIYCIDILNKDNYNLYSFKDHCNLCENYFKNSIPIAEENLDSHILTDIFCFSCACRLTEKILVLNTECIFNHIYCLNCYEKLETLGFKCTSCSHILNDCQKYYCYLCRIKVSRGKVTICKDHDYCDSCKKMLELKPFPVYTKIKNCENCNRYFFGKLKDKNTLSPPFNGGNNKNQQTKKNTVKNKSYQMNKKSIEEDKNCYENPIQKVENTINPDKNQGVLSLNTNLNSSMFQDSFGVCKFCRALGKLMECQHPFCYSCFSQSFRIMFNNFLKALRQGIYQINHENQIIKCIYDNCNSRYCIPFNSFKEIAIEDMKSNNLYVEGILDYYSLHFEGFPLSFYHCNCMGEVFFGIYPGDPIICHYCKINYNPDSYYYLSN